MTGTKTTSLLINKQSIWNQS